MFLKNISDKSTNHVNHCSAAWWILGSWEDSYFSALRPECEDLYDAIAITQVCSFSLLSFSGHAK
jgi:hypothetical protein